MSKKSNTARTLKPKMEAEETESFIMQEYRRLDQECDVILAKISQRKELKAKTNGQ